MSVKGIFEQVIARGGFDLTAMLARIDEYHIEGKIANCVWSPDAYPAGWEVQE